MFCHFSNFLLVGFFYLIPNFLHMNQGHRFVLQNSESFGHPTVSVYPQRADIRRGGDDVRFVPKAEVPRLLRIVARYGILLGPRTGSRPRICRSSAKSRLYRQTAVTLGP
jgi:hypothetical protein